jgi:hypothetical protein
MTDYPLTWLADVLRAAGCHVIEESGWKTRGRPASTGTFRPRALLRHWDASPPDSHNVNVLLNGNGSAPGPLCSIWTCDGNSSHGPSVHVIAAGRCNHGGDGNGWGTVPANDANTYAVGHEIRQTVDRPWPADQLEQVRKAEAAILERLSASPSDSLCSHSEYAAGRKIDTTEGSHGQDMGAERRAVQGYIDGTADTMAHNFLELKATETYRPPEGGQRVKFTSELADTGNTHADDVGAVKAPTWPCTMSGVVEVHVTEPTVDVKVERYGSDGEYVSRVGHMESLGVGYHNLPFTGLFSPGQSLYVSLEGHDDGGTVDFVRLTCDQFER